MSAPAPGRTAAAGQGTPPLVDDSRRGVDLRLLPVVVLLGFVHAGIGLTWSGMLSQSPAAVVMLSVLTMLTAGSVLMRPTTDRFELFRAVSFFCFVSYCVAPLFLPPELLNYYATSKAVLLTRSAALCLMAYVCFAIGYHLPFFHRIPRQVPLQPGNVATQPAIPVAMAFFLVGLVAFAVLFVQAGGVAVIIQGKGDLARNEFFTGIGVFFWLSMFMISGGTMYFAAMAARRPSKRNWVHAWPLFVTFALLLTLQGRHRALGPVIMALVISNYLVSRIALRRLAVYGLVGLTLSILVGAVRSPALRPLFAANPIGVTFQVLKDYPEDVRDLLVVDMSRLGEIMVVVDKIPDNVPYFKGISFLQITRPFLRLVALEHLQPKNVGLVLYPLARPEVVSDTRTGFLPSFVGEMRANFPWYLCPIPFVLFGVLLRGVYQGLIVRRGDFLAVAAYAIIGLFLCNSIIGTLNQNAFELMVVVSPVFLARMALAGTSPRARREPVIPVHPGAMTGSR